LFVLLGWLVSPGTFRSDYPLMSEISPNAALGFALIGLSYRMFRLEAVSNLARVVAKAFRVAVGLLGLLSFAEAMHALPVLGVDWLLLSGRETGLPASVLQMSSLSAFCFYLAGCALILLSARRGFLICEAVSLGLMVISFAAVVTRSLSPAHTFIPLATASVFLLVSAGFLYSNRHRGILSILASETSDGTMARRLLPACIAVPVVLAWLRLWAQRWDWFGPETGLVLHILATIHVLAVIVCWNAYNLNRRRKAAEAAPSEDESSWKEVLNRLTAPVWIQDLAGTVRYANLAAELLFNHSRLAGADVFRLVSSGSHDDLRRATAQALLGHSGATAILHIRGQEAEQYRVQVSLTVQYANGQPVTLVGIATDIQMCQRPDARRAMAPQNIAPEAPLTIN
jgi:PAS domain-containing protein